MTMLVSLALAVLLLLLCPGIGAGMYRLLRRGGTAEGWVLFCLGYAVLSHGVLALGLARGLTAPVIGAFLAAGCVASLVWGLPRVRANLRGRAALPSREGLRAPVNAILLALLTAHVALNLAGALAPPTEADSLAYHLAVPARWIREGAIVPLLDDDHASFVGSFEMLYTPALLLHGDRGPALLHLAFGLLVLALIVRMARPLGGRAIVAACLFYCLPVVTLASTVPKTELALTFFTTLALLFAWQAVERGGLPTHAAAGLAAGLATSVKMTGLGVVAILAFLVFAWSLSHRRRPARALTGTAVFVAVALLVAAPGYVTNALFRGNPFFPLFYDTLGGRAYDPVYAHDLTETLRHAYGVGRGFVDLLAAPWNVTLRVEHFGGVSGVLGCVYLTFLPAAVVRAWRRRGREGFGMAFCGLYALAWFFLFEQQNRFLLPILPALSVTVAGGMAEVQHWLGRAGVLVTGVLLANVGASLAASVLYNAPAAAVVAGRTSERDYLRTRTFYYDDLEWMNRNLPGDSRVLAHVRQTYYLHVPFAKDFPLALFGADDVRTAEALGAALRARGFTHYFRTPYALSTDERTPALMDAVLRRHGRLVRVNEASLQGYRNPFRPPEKVRTEVWALEWGGPSGGP